MNERAFCYYYRLRRVQDYAFSRPAEPLSLAAAAEIAGLERTYFSKFFHQKTGLCFRDWINEVHLQRAMSLLEESDLPITRVAHEAGFSSLRSLERVFARKIGMAPRDFKKSMRPGPG